MNMIYSDIKKFFSAMLDQSIILDGDAFLIGDIISYMSQNSTTAIKTPGAGIHDEISAVYLMWRALMIPHTRLCVMYHKESFKTSFLDMISYHMDDMDLGKMTFDGRSAIFPNGSTILISRYSPRPIRGYRFDTIVLTDASNLPVNVEEELFRSIVSMSRSAPSYHILQTKNEPVSGFVRNTEIKSYPLAACPEQVENLLRWHRDYFSSEELLNAINGT